MTPSYHPHFHRLYQSMWIDLQLYELKTSYLLKQVQRICFFFISVPDDVETLMARIVNANAFSTNLITSFVLSSSMMNIKLSAFSKFISNSR